MAKKLNSNIYLNQKDEPQGRRILMDTQEQPKTAKPKMEPERKQGLTKWLFFRPVVITVISLAVVCGIVFYGYDYFREKYFLPVDPNDSTPITVEIEKASSLTTIAQRLYDYGIIRDKNVFKLYTDFSDVSYKLKAGTYELSKSMTFDDIIYTLMKGEAASPAINVTLTEGMTIDTMAQTLVNKGVLKDSDKFLQLCTDASSYTDYPFIADVINKDDDRKFELEGYLFPDTYQAYPNSSADVVIKKQLDRFDQIFTSDYIAKAEERGLTIDQVITLASVIEKEGRTKDFKRISAVFYNRLDENMRLQSDATLQYATGLKKLTFTEEEKATKSPYNTYENTGLPVGPICNPSKDAIEAALYPDQQYIDDGYLYFCLTTPETGELVFAKTLEEHNKNLDEWQPYWSMQ